MSKRLLLAVLYLWMGSLVAWAGKYQEHVDYATGMEPHSLASGDFNGDGKVDLVTTSVFDTVSILLGNGDGTFQAHVDYGTGFLSEPFAVAVADFNGDGKLDLVTANFANFFGGSVSVLLGNGDGTFHNYVQYTTGGLPTSVAVGDFNNDGKPDLVVGDEDATTVSVLLGVGDGTFQASKTYDTGSAAPLSVAVGDFNRDGTGDVATANWQTGVVSVLLGKGDGTFPTNASYSTGTGSLPEWIAVGDFNGDKIADLAVADAGTNVVSVLLGNGDGTFQGHIDQAAGSFPNSLAIGDIDNDSVEDLVVTNLRVDSVYVLFGVGDGTLRPRATFKTQSCSNGDLCVRGAVLADFNGDRAVDLAIANDTDNSVSVLLNTGGSFVTTTSSVNPSKFGQPVTFTTTVAASVGSGRTPTGMVTFKDGMTTLGTAPLSNGQASLTTSSLAVGNHAIGAVYSGNTSFNSSTAAPITQQVLP